MEEQAGPLLQDAAVTFNRAARLIDPVRLHVWESMGLTLPQLRILFRVRARPGIDVRGLANDLGISASAVSQQVDKLVMRSMLTRTDDPEDRRHVRLDLTDMGRQATGEVSRATNAHSELLLASLSPAELEDLRRVLSVVIEAAAKHSTEFAVARA